MPPDVLATEILVGRPIRLYDADALSDDFLSRSTVEPDGAAGLLFDLSSSRSLDSLFETKPDLYCVVSGDDGRILYRSDIHANTDFRALTPTPASSTAQSRSTFTKPEQRPTTA